SRLSSARPSSASSRGAHRPLRRSRRRSLGSFLGGIVGGGLGIVFFPWVGGSFGTSLFGQCRVSSIASVLTCGTPDRGCPCTPARRGHAPTSSRLAPLQTPEGGDKDHRSRGAHTHPTTLFQVRILMASLPGLPLPTPSRRLP